MKKTNIILPKKFYEIEKSVDSFLSNVGINAFDNYNHRTTRVWLVVKTLWNDYEISTKRNGKDSYCKSLDLNDIEIKTININSNKSTLITNLAKTCFSKMNFMFDKQDREVRRKLILEYDGLIFAVFVFEKLKLVFWTCDSNTMNEYRNIAIKKQESFLNNWNKIQNEGKKSGHDAIHISIKDFSNNSKWNFYWENKVYQDATIDEAKTILGLKNL